jgi:hypothetical protein
MIAGTSAAVKRRRFAGSVDRTPWHLSLETAGEATSY